MGILDNRETYDISVIVPVYNREKTIKRCMNSILCQTYPVIEIILVDDGSTDRTVEIVEQNYNDDRIRILKQKNKGAQAARNAGISAAKGTYIAFLDSDDEWLPEKLEVQVQALQRNKNGVICGNGYVQMDWKKGVPEAYRKLNIKQEISNRKVLHLNGKNGFVYKYILMESFCMFQSLLTSKENLIKIGLLDEKVPSFQEWDTAIRLAQTNKFIFIQKPLFIYHLHDGDTISKNVKKDIDGREYICEKFQYEIIAQLGSRGLTLKYRQMMQKCAEYRDVRYFKYLVRFLFGCIHLFFFR